MFNDYNKNKLIVIAALVGFVGDILLQLLNLDLFKTYFAQHGPLESMLIASGLVSMLYFIYLYPLSYLFALPSSGTSGVLYFSLYILCFDIFLRHTRIFKSLDYFYDQLNYFQSGIPGAVLPALIPMVVFWFLR
jgi:hypothetical protein